MPDATEREFLEGLGYEDKYPAEERAEALRLAQQGLAEMHGWTTEESNRLARALVAAESERAELLRKGLEDLTRIEAVNVENERLISERAELAREVERLTGLLREANYDATDSDGMLPRNPLL